jgi:hypothetical protein
VTAIYLKRCEGAFDCPCYTKTAQGVISHVAPAIHWSKDGATRDSPKLPPGFQSALRTGRVTRPAREAFGKASAFLIGL